jgi:sulfur relay (sulfurtransferase) complex TusBCD TusD component (DsrE family)
MTALTGKKLGFLISSHPERDDLAHAAALAGAALDAGGDVYLYLIDEGTRYYHDPRLAALAARGLKLYVCAYGGKSRGVEPDSAAVFCGLAALGGLVDACDRFVSFN